MNKTEMIEEIVGTGVQLAYEYPGFGDEHLDDMWSIMPKEIKTKYSVDDLNDCACEARKQQEARTSYEEAIKKVTKWFKNHNK